MTFPAHWTRIQVSGTYLDNQGNPLAGSVTFDQAPNVVSIPDNEVVQPLPIVAVLDLTGSFSIMLPATNDPDTTPINWAWRVTERVPNRRPQYYINVPYNSAPINLATVGPVIPLPPYSVVNSSLINFQQGGTGSVSETVTKKLAQIINIDDYGGDSTGATFSDAALAWAIASVAINPVGTAHVAGPTIQFSPGVYAFQNTIQLKTTVTLRGAASGGANTYATKLTFPAGVTGIIVQSFNTTGSTSGSSTTGADGSYIADLWIAGGWTFADNQVLGVAGLAAAQAYPDNGIWLRTRAVVERCKIDHFSGTGFQVVANSAGTGDQLGLANGWSTSRLRIQNCGRAAYIAGTDANAGYSELFDIASCSYQGLYDSSFLANTHVASQVAGVGRASQVSYGGNRYYYIDSAMWHKTTAYTLNTIIINGPYAYTCTTAGTSASSGGPTGTGSGITDGTAVWAYLSLSTGIGAATVPGTNALVWVLIGVGGVVTGNNQFPAWTNATTYGAGHPYEADDANSITGFYSCYVEDGQPPSFIMAPAFVMGGNLSQISTVNVSSGAFITSDSTGALINYRPWKYQDLSNVLTSEIGTGNALDFTLWTHSTYFPNSWRWTTDTSAQDLIFTYQNSGSLEPLRITGPTSTTTFGRSAAVPYATYVSKLFVGSSLSGAAAIAQGRQITFATAAPTSGNWSQGDRVFNSNATVGQPTGWACTVTGTPGTWVALANL